LPERETVKCWVERADFKNAVLTILAVIAKQERVRRWLVSPRCAGKAASAEVPRWFEPRWSGGARLD